MKKLLLPFHPMPTDGESHRGYLLRVATGNGYKNMNWLRCVPGFVQFMTFGPGRLLLGRKASWTHSTLSERNSAGGGGSPFIQTIEARFCPLCLSEIGIWRLEWEWAYYVACHRHKMRLLSTCSSCGRSQTPSRRKLLECNCGATLSRQPSTTATTAEVSISVQVLNAQHGARPGDAGPLPSIGTIIGKHDFESVCKFIRTIGIRNSAFDADEDDCRYLAPTVPIARRHVLNTAEVLHDWPTNFTAFMLAYGELNGALPGTYSRSEKLKMLLRKLQWTWTDTNTPLSHAISDLLTKYEPRVLDGRQGDIPSKWQAAGRFAHITAIARSLRVATNRVEELIASGEIHAHRRMRGKREFILIPNEEVVRINLLLEDAISHKAAAKLLGISRTRLGQLHRKGLISARSEGQQPGKVRYSVRNLERLVARFKIQTSPYNREQLETVAHICKFAATDDEYTTIVQACLDGSLNVYGHHEEFGSIGGLLLARSEWQAWRERVPKGQSFSVVEASAQLGIKQEVTYHLLKMGMIKAYCGKSGRRMTKLLSFDSLEAFKQVYISAVELADANGTSPKAMIEKLFRQKIYPVTGPQVDGCRQYFYLRADFEKSRALGLSRYDVRGRAQHATRR